MGNFKDEERLKALRERLYARGKTVDPRPKPELTDTPKEVPTTWQKPPRDIRRREQTLRKPESVLPQKQEEVNQEPKPIVSDMAPKKTSRKYRLYVVAAGVLFFVIAVLVSSVFFVLGGNKISGNNIAVSLNNGPFTIGGGETLTLQAGVTNQNAVPIESATLIVTYPRGTQSADEEGKELFIERLPLETIEPGETLNIPLRAVVFGEENDEKTVTAELEYRVTGSNSTFSKVAEPYIFRISSSPVVMSVDSLYKVSSGQEIDIELTISSNAPNTLTDIIVTADYPIGFDYSSSDPEPISGQNVWHIDSLEPESEKKVTITGVVVGEDTDEYTMLFSVGVPSEGSRSTLASVFSTASADFQIEQPFIGVSLKVNNDTSETVAVEADDTVDIEISITNTLPYTIYDGKIELALSGNALSDYTVNANSGFYNSANNTVTWEPTTNNTLREIESGKKIDVRVTLKPDPDIEVTPQLAFDVDVHGRRVTEGRVTEELIGTAAAVAKVSSVATIQSETGRNTSIFTDTGPIPPVAEEETSYTLTFFIQNGTNDIGDAEIMATLPVYVKWLDKTTGAGTITFNETSRTVAWNVGSVDANQSKIASFQVSLLPSISQIGTTPTLLGEQRLRATDRFTGAVVRARSNPLNSRLSSEAGYNNQSGEVVEN